MWPLFIGSLDASLACEIRKNILKQFGVNNLNQERYHLIKISMHFENLKLFEEFA